MGDFAPIEIERIETADQRLWSRIRPMATWSVTKAMSPTSWELVRRAVWAAGSPR